MGDMSEITITAEPLTGPRCVFLVGRPVAPDQWAYVADREASRGSPLAERVFVVDGVASLVIAHDLIVVTRSGSEGLPLVGPYVRMVRRVLGDPSATPIPWKTLGKGVAKAVRRAFRQWGSAWSSELIASMPTAEVLRGRVQMVLGGRINPVVASHGGGVELLDLIDKLFTCACREDAKAAGSPTSRSGMASMRPSVTMCRRSARIHDLTNHAAGLKPYREKGSSPFAMK